MKQYFVDRVEEGRFVVCEAEDGSRVVFEKSAVLGEVQEGDCLVETDGVLTVDGKATHRRRERLITLQRKLFGK